MNIILKAIINFIKAIIGKMAYNKQISDLKKKEDILKDKVKESKQKAKSLKDKLKQKPVSKDAKDAKQFLKDFLK